MPFDPNSAKKAGKKSKLPSILEPFQKTTKVIKSSGSDSDV